MCPPLTDGARRAMAGNEAAHRKANANRTPLNIGKEGSQSGPSESARPVVVLQPPQPRML